MVIREFRIGGCVVRPSLGYIERAGLRVHLRPKSMDVLAFLASRAGEVAGRDELLAAIWADVSVGEEGLTRCVAEIRDALDDDVSRPTYVETVPKRGYRLIAPVTWIGDSGPDAALPRVGLLVLPFENLSRGNDDEYIADGLTEEITSGVAGIPALRVISRTSAMALKGSRRDLRSLGRQLGVDYVVEGSVRRSGGVLRISAQLIDASSDSHLWAGHYSGSLDALFDAQEGVARAVVSALGSTLPAGGRTIPVTRARIGPAAYDCYLRARSANSRFTAEGAREAITLLEAGLATFGEHALLHAGLGYAYFRHSDVGPLRVGDFEHAEAHADAARRLDPGNAQSYLVLGLVQNVWHGDTLECVRLLRRAVALDPAEPDALWWLVIVLGHFLGQPDAAWPLANHLTRIDPLNPMSQAVGGTLHFCAGRFDLAFETFRQAFPDPQIPAQRAWLAVGLTYARRDEEALAVIAPVRLAPGADFWTSLCVLLGHAIRGDVGRAREVITPEFTAVVRRGQHYSWQVASVFARLGEEDTALDWLEHAMDRGYVNYPHVSAHDPFLAGLRRLARFRRLMDRMKRRWELAGAACSRTGD